MDETKVFRNAWYSSDESTYNKLLSQQKEGQGFTVCDPTFTHGCYLGSFKSKWTPKETFKEKDSLSITMAVKIVCKLLKDIELFNEVETNMSAEKIDHLIENTYQESSNYMTIAEILKNDVEYRNISAYDYNTRRRCLFFKATSYQYCK